MDSKLIVKLDSQNHPIIEVSLSDRKISLDDEVINRFFDLLNGKSGILTAYPINDGSNYKKLVIRPVMDHPKELMDQALELIDRCVSKSENPHWIYESLVRNFSKKRDDIKIVENTPNGPIGL